jgi:hypothetical protein
MRRPGDDARAIDDIRHREHAFGVPLRPEGSRRVGENDQRQIQTIGPNAGIGSGRRPARRVLRDDADRREPLGSEVDVELIDALDQGLTRGSPDRRDVDERDLASLRVERDFDTVTIGHREVRGTVADG